MCNRFNYGITRINYHLINYWLTHLAGTDANSNLLPQAMWGRQEQIQSDITDIHAWNIHDHAHMAWFRRLVTHHHRKSQLGRQVNTACLRYFCWHKGKTMYKTSCLQFLLERLIFCSCRTCWNFNFVKNH